MLMGHQASNPMTWDVTDFPGESALLTPSSLLPGRKKRQLSPSSDLRSPRFVMDPPNTGDTNRASQLEGVRKDCRLQSFHLEHFL